MSHPLLRVVKVGGSLLSYDRLGETLTAWFQSQPEAINVIVVGGGRAADLVRDADQRFALRAEQSHWLAVQAMGLTARLVRCLLPEASMIDNLAAIQAVAGIPSVLIVDPEPLLRAETGDLGPSCLPHDWRVTSDSIAARIAEAIGADELVLLKSAPMICETWEEAADAGYVDAWFPIAAAGLKSIRAINLRDATMEPAPQPAYLPPCPAQ